MNSNYVEMLRETFAFRLHPMDAGDGGIAFTFFLNFATGSTDEARRLQAAYFNATGKSPRYDAKASAHECGEYIDWLIENHWGEAAADGLMH